jgi:hypothetical protein
MPSLRDYLFGYQAGEVVEPEEFMVYNTNTLTSYNSGNNGRCCCWVVPAGKSYAIFEVWSGGGSGSGVCCCTQGGGAGSGGYAIKGVNVCPGDVFTLCAASAGCCPDPSAWSGTCGFCSFICANGGGGGSTWLAKVCGGRLADDGSRCYYWQNCYACCSMCWCCGGITSGTWDFCVPGTTGKSHPNQYCYANAYNMSASAPFTAGGYKFGPTGCRSWHAGCGCGHFPGGGGLGAAKYDSQCCGGEWGGGGLIYVVYY